jgi:eukaryotic-like serine/threonine-protein kinase
MSAPVKIGETLAGKYTVERVLGVGGMGVVVAAKHIHLGERVAIKFLLPHALAREDVVARFLREGQAAAKMKSEHIARVRDVGTLDSGAPYLVMEYLDGDDLGAILRARGSFPMEVAVSYILQTCEALADAHAAGVIHRDLKPGNLFLTRKNDGTPVIKVIDFGISKVGVTGEAGPPEAGSGEMTQTAMMMGSPLYMAPEQMASARDVDARSDIWSLGIILHTLLTGQPPFKAPSVMQVYELIMAGAPPLRSVLPGAPEGLEKILLKCLQKQRKDRYDNVADLAAALVEFGPAAARESAERSARILRVNSGKGSEPPLLATGSPALADAATPGAPDDSQKPERPRALSLPGISGASLSASLPGDPNASQGPWDRGASEHVRKRPSRSVLAIGGVGVVVIAAGIFAALRGEHTPGSPLPAAADSAIASSPVAAATSPRDPLVPSVVPVAPAPSLAAPTATVAASAAMPVAVAPSATVPSAPITPRGRPSASRSIKPPADPFGGSQK